jgi:hypothetical protein
MNLNTISSPTKARPTNQTFLVAFHLSIEIQTIFCLGTIQSFYRCLFNFWGGELEDRGVSRKVFQKTCMFQLSLSYLYLYIYVNHLTYDFGPPFASKSLAKNDENIYHANGCDKLSLPLKKPMYNLYQVMDFNFCFQAKFGSILF